MKRAKFINQFIFFLFFVIIGFFIQVELAWADNKIKNPGFEDGMSGWENTQQGGSEIVSNEKKVGDKSVLVKNSNSTGSYGIEQQVAGIEEKKNYLLEGWAKIADPQRTDRIRLRIAWYDCDNADCGQMSTEDSNQVETQEWSYLRLEAVAPEKAKSAKVRLILMAKENGVEGQAYFDEIKLDKYEPEPTATPSPTPAPTSTPKPTSDPEKPTPTQRLKPTISEADSKDKQLNLNELNSADKQEAVTGVDELRQKIKGYGIEAAATDSAVSEDENKSNKKIDVLALGLIGGGGLLLIGAGIPIIKNLKKFKK